MDGNSIAYAGLQDGAPAFEADEVIDGSGMLAMPGLCNMHTHTPVSYTHLDVYKRQYHGR